MRLITIDDAMKVFDDFTRGDLPTEDLLNLRIMLEEKEIPSAEPKEVIYSGDGYADGHMVYDMANCPNCGREYEDGCETWECDYCPDCGQALKWEEEE